MSADDVIKPRASFGGEQLRALAESAPVGLFQTDAQGNCLFVNARWRELAGMSLEAALGKGWLLALHPEDRDRVAVEWYAAAQEGREFKSDYRFETKDGKTTWLNGSAVAVRNDQGEITGYVGTVTDITDRKAAEARLVASERQLRLVTDHAPVGIARCSKARRFRFVNKTYAERFGLTPDDLIGRTIREVLGPDACQLIEPYIERALGGERVEYEIEIPYPHLGTRLMQCGYEPERGTSGAVVGWVAVVMDVTERKRALESLRQIEHRFGQFMEHLPGLAWIKDLDGRYVYANDAALSAFRASRESLYGKTDEEVFPPATAAQFRANDAQAAATPGGIQAIETLADRDGMLRFSLVSKFIVPGPNDRPAFVGGMAIDITERMQIESDLRRHKERLELAQHAGGIGTFEWDIHTDEVRWSATGEELFGLTAGAFGGRLENWQAAVHLQDRERAVADCRRAVDEQSELATEFRIVRPDGEVRWIFAHGKLLRDERGRPVRMIGVNIDVTERKRAEEILRETDRRKDEFLAMLAHELRNPLAPICTSLEVLKLSHLQPEVVEQMRQVIERQVHQLVRLVDDLLDVSRVMRGKIELRKEPLELATAVARAVETAQPLIDARRQRLSIELPKASLLVEGDPVRLAQVIANLLTNAAKYTEAEGCIWLTAQCEDGHAVLRIRDNGIGISAELLSQIFDLFVQADHGAARSQGGLGIGLTLVKTLVEMHGGTVTAVSAGLGAGSEFTVRLPLVRRQVCQPGVNHVAEGRRTIAAHRLMVVDDNRDAADSLALLLRLQGHEVAVAHSGESALETAESFRPEMIFLDIGMPGMDGYEVALEMRKRPELRGTLLTALTGWGQPEDRRRTLEAGFDYHLIKPAEPTALSQILDELTP